MRLKPGLIPYFLNKEKIKFTKCGVSQISFEKNARWRRIF